VDARIHPYVVHFAVTLILVSVLLFLLGSVFRQRSWAAMALTAARWNLWVGAACALASIGTGFVDYIGSQCDQAAIDATVVHRRSGAVTWWSSLIAGIAAFRTRHRPPGPMLMTWLLLVAAATFTVTRLGTDLTYQHGLGVDAAWPDGTQACFELERGRQPPA
jgi:uncharacterized membrane protein